jgi:WD40 repeat protein
VPWFRTVTLLAVAAPLLACEDSGTDPGPAPEPPGPGAIHLSVLTSGRTLDPNGYTARLNGTVVQQLALQDSAVLGDLDSGSYTVELTDVASNCAAQPSASRTLTLAAGGSALLDFHVQCDTALRDVILFTRYDGTGPEGITVVAVRPDGTGLQTLFPGASPSVSPDGRFVLESRFGIYRLRADGTEPLDLTPATSGDQMAEWSPDGTRIAFTSDRSGQWQLYTMFADGTGQHRMTQSDRQETSPRWSPDGSRILIGRDSGTGWGDEVVAVRADGSGEDVLSGPGGSSNPLGWSPDGTRILLNSNADGVNNIWVMNADGTSPSNLTAGSGFPNGSARWGPGGDEIVFDRGTEAGAEIVRLNLSDSLTTPVTITAPTEWAVVAAWLP